MSGIEILPELRGKDLGADVKNWKITDPIPDELRGKRPEELVAFVEVLDAHLRCLHQDENTGEIRSMSLEEHKAFDYGLAIRDIANQLVEHHRAISDVFSKRPRAVQAALAGIKSGVDAQFGDVRRMLNGEARDRALRVLDDRGSSAHLRADQKDAVERQIRGNTDLARRIIVTENEAYRNAWMKLVTMPNGHIYLDDDERNAMRAYEEYRVASLTSAAGGFAVPVFIDPSIIMTAQGSDNPFLTIARQVDVNTNAWKGVSSAGVTWSFDAENAEVSDDAATIAQPSVTVHMARGFIPYSIEIGEDWPGFAAEMSTLLAEGYDELLIDKFTRGSGSGEPQGALTAISASAGCRVSIQTSGSAFGANDPYNVWKALPQRFRRKASWLMSVDVNNKLRQLGTANVFHAFTENLPAEWADTFFGKTAYESPYMPDTTTSTAANTGLVLVGDFKNYLIARRTGMSVELIPHIFSTGANLPMGQRGWFAYARLGGGVVNTSGFRLLVNTA